MPLAPKSPADPKPRNRAQSTRAKNAAIRAEVQLRERVYAGGINGAFHAVEANNLGRARELLRKQIPKAGDADLRGFEWRYLWRQTRSDAEHIVRAHKVAASCAVFSPDGNRLVTSGFDRTCKVWRLSQNGGSLARSRFFTGGHPRNSIAFSTGGELFAMVAGYDIVVRSVSTWKERYRFRVIRGSTEPWWGPVIFLGKDGGIAAKVPNGVAIWKLRSGERRLIPGDDEFGMKLAFSSREDVLAIGNIDQIQLWNPKTQTLLKTLDNGDSPIRSLASSKNGDLLAAGRMDGTIELIAVAQQRVLKSWKAHASHVYALAFSPSGDVLATGGVDQVIRIWNVASVTDSPSSLEPTRTLRGHENQVWALDFSPDGQWLVSSCKDGSVALWKVSLKSNEESSSSRRFSVDLDPLSSKTQFGDFSGKVRSSDRRVVARVQEREVATVELRDAQSDELLHLLPINQWSISSMIFSPSDQLLAVGSHDNFVHLWDTASGQEQLILRGHMAAVSALAFSQDERTLASGSTDGTVKLWSLATGQEMISRRFPRGTVANVKFSDDGRALGIRLNDKDGSIERLRAPSWDEIRSAKAEGR